MAASSGSFDRKSMNRWRDTMHYAAAANLPRALAACAKALGIPFEENLKDSNRIRRITNLNRTPVISLEDLKWLCDRCVLDVQLEEEVLKRLPPGFDVSPWDRMPEIDRKINDRGARIDVELVRGLAKAAATEQARLDAEMAVATDNAVAKVSKIESLKAWLMANGIVLPKKGEKPVWMGDVEEEEEDDEEEDKDIAYRLRKSDVADLLARDDLPEACRRALEIRLEAAKVSIAKLRKMLAVVSPEDHRLRGLFVLGGAQQTMRWSGVLVQAHNLVRDVIGNFDEAALQNGLDPKTQAPEVEAAAQRCLDTAVEVGTNGDADLIRCVFTMTRKDNQDRPHVDGVLTFISRMMRRTFVSAPGRVLLNGDYSQIEARIPVWLAGQEDKVQVFARGEDIYRATAAPFYGKMPEELSSTERQTGKVEVLALGFGGGVGALVSMAMAQGLLISRAQGEPVVRSFRESNSMLVAFWDATLAAARAAIMNPGQVYWVPPKWLVSWCVQGNCLMCRLPSGRLLRYWSPKLVEGHWPDGSPKDEPDITALAIKGKAVFRRVIWRGLACENITQAIAVDILANALVNVDAAGLEVVLHVHDSIAAEVDRRQAEARLPEFKAAMLAVPAWAAGLPVAAKVHISERFG